MDNFRKPASLFSKYAILIRLLIILSLFNTGVDELQIEANAVIKSTEPVTAMVQGLTLVADKSIPESNFNPDRINNK